MARLARCVQKQQSAGEGLQVVERVVGPRNQDREGDQLVVGLGARPLGSVDGHRCAPPESPPSDGLVATPFTVGSAMVGRLQPLAAAHRRREGSPAYACEWGSSSQH